MRPPWGLAFYCVLVLCVAINARSSPWLGLLAISASKMLSQLMVNKHGVVLESGEPDNLPIPNFAQVRNILPVCVRVVSRAFFFNLVPFDIKISWRSILMSL